MHLSGRLYKSVIQEYINNVDISAGLQALLRNIWLQSLHRAFAS